MNPTTINSSPAGTLLTFTLKQTIAGTDAPGIVAYDAPTKVATFTATSDFAPNTNYTATISTAAKDLAGNALASNKVWTFTTNALPCAPPPVSSNPLGTAATFGTFWWYRRDDQQGNSNLDHR
ncbi:Ig-like domain-containing protein [Undibacterium arcticum]